MDNGYYWAKKKDPAGNVIDDSLQPVGVFYDPPSKELRVWTLGASAYSVPDQFVFGHKLDDTRSGIRDYKQLREIKEENERLSQSPSVKPPDTLSN